MKVKDFGLADLVSQIFGLVTSQLLKGFVVISYMGFNSIIGLRGQ